MCHLFTGERGRAITTAKRRLATAVRPARVVFRKEIGAAVTDAVGPTQAGLQAEVTDLRRLLEDDMDASNEATAVFGRLLSQLRDRLDAIDGTLQAMATRLDALERVPDVRAVPAASQARRTPAKGAPGKAGPADAPPD